jgi:CDP-diacylglycerol--glycerol-3-phosphate 3-phosphatidyltransferase
MNNFIQFLTYFRIFTAPLIFFLIVSNYFGSALILVLLASASDFWDGYLARKYELESTFGSVIDPIADKILITFLILALSLNMTSAYIGFVGGIILVREFWVSALRDVNARADNESATQVTFLAKTKTFIQLSSFIILLFGLYFDKSLVVFIGQFFLFLSLVVTLKSGLEYTVNTFKSLK